MIKQFEPPTFFVTFITTCVNNLSTPMKTLKDLHNKHFQQNVKIIFNNPLTNRDFVNLKRLAYTTLSYIHSEEHLYLLVPLSNKNFYVDPSVQ
jgi:hypothetical protein